MTGKTKIKSMSWLVGLKIKLFESEIKFSLVLFNIAQYGRLIFTQQFAVSCHSKYQTVSNILFMKRKKNLINTTWFKVLFVCYKMFSFHYKMFSDVRSRFMTTLKNTLWYVSAQLIWYRSDWMIQGQEYQNSGRWHQKLIIIKDHNNGRIKESWYYYNKRTENVLKSMCNMSHSKYVLC